MLKPPEGVKPGIIGPRAIFAERTNWLVVPLGVPVAIALVVLLWRFGGKVSPSGLLACLQLLMLAMTTFFLLSVPFLVASMRLTRGHALDLADLESRDFRACTRCRYDLTQHAESGACPECGTAFTSKLLRRSWRWTYEEAMPVRIADSEHRSVPRIQSSAK